MTEKTIFCERRHMSENPPINADVMPTGAEDGNVPEIKPVKPLGFVPEKCSVKTVNCNSNYSDVVDTDNEIAKA